MRGRVVNGSGWSGPVGAPRDLHDNQQRNTEPLPIDTNAPGMARFLEWKAARQQMPPQPQKKPGTDIVASLINMSRERSRGAAAKERNKMPRGTPVRLSDDEVRKLHVEKYQKGATAGECAKSVGCGTATLTKRFRELGLPVSPRVEQRAWQPGTPLPSLNGRPDPEPQPKPKPQPTTATAVAIAQPDAVDLAVQPHDPAMAPAIAGAIRELAAMPGVQVRGSIKLNLEVDFGDTQ